MTFVLGYIFGVSSVVITLAVLIIIAKAKQSYDYFKHK